MSAADKRRITADWASQLPRFAVWQPLRLLRRLGPVVLGVTLEVASSGDYLPTAHVHALTRRFPTIAMTLPVALRTEGGVQDRIRLRHHTLELVRDAVDRLRTAFPLPFSTDVAIEDLVAAYRQEISLRHRPGWPVSVNEIEDQVLIPAVEGRADLLASGLEFAAAIAADWPRGALERWGRGDEWLDDLAALAARPDDLRAIVKEEVAAHRLESLPMTPLS